MAEENSWLKFNGGWLKGEYWLGYLPFLLVLLDPEASSGAW
jgi:hypothetical protein